MSLLFTADLHFFHHRMATHWRGYESLDAMHEHIVHEWNAMIGPRDEVWVLGDFSFSNATKVQPYFDRLNGRKHLIVGNHDGPSIRRLGWESVQDFRRVKHEGATYYCFHYPMLTWPNAHKGTLHLHGHSHGNLRAPVSTRMDVGIDALGAIAIPVEDVYTILSARTYDYIDHHTEEDA